jgi:trigger factor
MVNEQLDSIQKQFGTKIVKETFEAGNDVKGTITNEEKNINAAVDFNCNIFKNKDIEASLLGKKSGEIITFSSVDLFDNDHKLMDFLRIDHSITHGLDVVLSLEITDILEIQKADLNQELFDKLFGEGKVNSTEELKEKLKEDIERQYVSHTDSQFLIALDRKLIESTKIDLPKEFLTRWIQFTSKTEISIEEAAQEYEKSENGLKFQLIEAKIINDNNLQITFDELKDFTAAQIKQQMLMYGMQNLDDKMIDETTMRILSKREEVERQSNQLKEIKMLNFYKETVKINVKEVNVDQFIKEINNE